MDEPKKQQLRKDELTSLAKLLWGRFHDQAQSQFLSDVHVYQPALLMSNYLDVVFKFSLRVLQESCIESNLAKADEEELLSLSPKYIKIEFNELNDN